jgi:hypothetical protein
MPHRLCALNGHDLAVAQVIAIAAGHTDEAAMDAWLTTRIKPG